MFNRYRDLLTIFFAKTVNLNVSQSSLFVLCGHDMPGSLERTLNKTKCPADRKFSRIFLPNLFF